MGWLSSWDYRKEITINNTGSELTNYQLQFFINRSTGTSSGATVYIGTKCEEDYDDIRFTAADGSTVLDYWIESATTGSATVWVETSSLTASDDTVAYLYYGHAEAPTGSNGDDTFLLFDDFSSASLDTDKWTQNNGSVSITDGIIGIEVTSSSRYGIYSNTAFGTDHAIRALWKTTDGSIIAWPAIGFDSRVSGGAKYTAFYKGGNTDRFLTISYDTGISSTDSGASDTSFHILDIIRNGSTSVIGIIDGNEYTVSAQIPTDNIAVGLSSSAISTTSNLFCDWVAVREYTATEPTISAWGDEEEFISVTGSVIGVYSIPQSGNLISKYSISLATDIIGVYGQGVSKSLISKYSVIPSYGFSGSSRFTIEILDPILEEGQYMNLTVKKGMNQVHIFEVDVINPSETLKAQLLYNAPVRIRVNDRLLFTGLIKRVDKQDNLNIYKLYGEGGSSLLKDLVTSTTQNYEHTRSFYIIEDLLPATNWEMIAGDGGTDYGSYIDYTVTPGPVLNHISNICKMQNHDWDVTQIRGSFTSTDISGDTITLDTAPTPDGYYDNRYGAFTTGAAKDTGFTITDQTGAVLTTTGFSTLAVTGDKVVLWGKYLLQSGTHLGSYATVAHYRVNEDIFDLKRQRNLDKVVTSYIGVGQLPEVSRFITYATACTLNTASLASTETYLTANATTGSATLYAFNTSGYLDTGTIQIGSELIQYTNKGATTFTGLTRAYNSTASATHYVGDSVLLTSALVFDDLSAFPSSGFVWLGAERIEYETKDSTHLYTLTRGASDTPKYHHYSGTYAFDATYTDDSPQAGSMVGNYGVRRARIAIMGATTRDAMDKRVQQELFRNATDSEYGSFKLLSTDFWQDIKLGDEILVTDYDGNDNCWRIIEVNYNQYKPVTVFFGQTDDYILEDIARIDTVSDIATEKADLADLGTVTEISADGKKVKVTLDSNGESVWTDAP